MKKTTIENYIEDINANISKTETTKTYFREGEYSNELEGAYLFKIKEQTPSFFKKIIHTLSPMLYDELYNQPLLKIKPGMSLDYMPQVNAYIMTENDPEFEALCTEIAKKHPPIQVHPFIPEISYLV